MWKLNHVGSDDFAWTKNITIESAVEAADQAIEVRINTKELIDAGRMNPYCTDVIFFSTGEVLEVNPYSYYLDSYPGCYATDTLFLVKLPSIPVGKTVFSMLHGNPSMGLST